MYQYSYIESLDDNAGTCRERERNALEQAIALLMKAEVEGPRSLVAVEAVTYLRRLWNALIEDLGNPENDLPVVLRADLISIGIWIIKEADMIRVGQSENFNGLIEICSIIRDGLK
jgi:flagellar protein FlaF